MISTLPAATCSRTNSLLAACAAVSNTRTIAVPLFSVAAPMVAHADPLSTPRLASQVLRGTIGPMP